MDNKINIVNKKATYEYQFIEKWVAGIQLTGTEIKSLRQGKASLGDAFCVIKKNELWVKNMHITEYEKGTYANHEPLRTRKLLLRKSELKKLDKKVREKGLTIIPVSVFISERGFAKIEIALAKGKKVHDKRVSIKEKDTKREFDREMKRR